MRKRIQQTVPHVSHVYGMMAGASDLVSGRKGSVEEQEEAGLAKMTRG
jgi:hypothetical protein